MPALDKVKARSDLEGARNAYRGGPRADFIQRLADHLEGALAGLDEMQLAASRNQSDSVRLQRELENERTQYRLLREKLSSGDECVVLLKQIAASPKGAAKKAADLLAKLGIKDEVLEEAPVAAAEKVVVP